MLKTFPTIDLYVVSGMLHASCCHNGDANPAQQGDSFPVDTSSNPHAKELTRDLDQVQQLLTHSIVIAGERCCA